MIRIADTLETPGSRSRYGFLIAVLMVLLLVGAVTPVGSQEVQILPINPVPELEEPPLFDFGGRIDVISEADIIIDDQQHLFSVLEPITYYGPDGTRLTSRASFAVGDWVGCIFDDDDAIMELWKLDGPIGRVER